MALKTWLLFLFALASAFAGEAGDYRFTVPEDQFEENARILNAKNVCIDGGDSAYLHAEKVRYPLEPGKLYLRSKVKGNRYGWYSGSAKPECFKTLHAFGLRENRLSVLEASRLRFFAERLRKPFQDEAEIYFDKKFLYSSRVETLYFLKNGKWQKLKPAALSGIVVIDDVPDSTVVVIGQNSFRTPVTFSPVDTGLFYATFLMPHMYPVTSGTRISSGKTSFLKPVRLPEDTTVYQIETSVSKERIAATQNLLETEALYDTFIEDLNRAEIARGTAGFDSTYPKPKNPPRGMSKTDPQYEAYLAAFDLARSRARSQWLSKRLSKILDLNAALRTRLDALEKDTLSLLSVPLSLAKKDSSYEIAFRDSANRIDVKWAGNFPGRNSPIDATDRFLLVFENKPVWKYDGFRVKSRHQYRFLKLLLQRGDSTFVGEGKFILPGYILAEDEVQEWLMPAPVVVDSANGSAIKVEAKDSLPEDVSRAWAKIDSGAFLYKGRTVRLSAFAIRKTEVTVGEYSEVMQDSTHFVFPDSLMPAHNVSWEQANRFCEKIGGRLPTEAEWEFAARSGGNGSFVWEEKKNARPFEFVIFRAEAPARVASAKPNAFGLFDVAGNVAEWTRDTYSLLSFYVESENPSGSFLGYERVFKGGSWKSASEKELDLTARKSEDPRYWSNFIGFRCVLPQGRF